MPKIIPRPPEKIAAPLVQSAMPLQVTLPPALIYAFEKMAANQAPPIPEVVKPQGPRNLTIKVSKRVRMSDGSSRIKAIEIYDDNGVILSAHITQRADDAAIQEVQITQY